MLPSRALSLAFVAGVLAGCGAAAAGLAPVTAPAVLPSTQPAPTAAVRGTVLDAVTASGIGGATVAVGTSFAGGALGGAVASTRTAPDGSFALTVPLSSPLPVAAAPAGSPAIPAGTTAMLWIQIAAASYATLHRALYVQAGPVQPNAYRLAATSATDLTAIAQVNADRATFAGAAPLGLDNDLTLAARFDTATMAAQGFYGHDYPGTTTLVTLPYLCGLDALCGRYPPLGAYAENLDATVGAGSLLAAEAAYVAEGPSGEHYQRIMNAQDVWIGLGAAVGRCDPSFAVGPGGTCGYFAEEFVAGS